MSADMDEWLNIVRREAHNVAFHGQMKSTLICTSYDPKKHAIKGILVPHGVESGWMPVGAHHIGNGFGILVGPKTGDAQKLDGDQFDIDFEFGDPNRPIAKQRIFSTPDTPPEVQSGEMLLQHESGMKIKFDKDKNLTVTGSNANQQIVIDKDGGVTAQDKDKATMVLSGGNATLTDNDNGVVYVSGGKIYLGEKSANSRVMTENGLARNTFAAT